MRPEKVDRTTHRRIHQADPNQTSDQNQLIQTRDPNKTTDHNQLITCSLSEDAMTVELILNDMECDVMVLNPEPQATMIGTVVSNSLGSGCSNPQDQTSSSSSSCLQSVIDGGTSSSSSSSCYLQHKSPEQLTGDSSEVRRKPHKSVRGSQSISAAHGGWVSKGQLEVNSTLNLNRITFFLVIENLLSFFRMSPSFFVSDLSDQCRKLLQIA